MTKAKVLALDEISDYIIKTDKEIQLRCQYLGLDIEPTDNTNDHELQMLRAIRATLFSHQQVSMELEKLKNEFTNK
jgi:hypothetical protein